MAFDCNGITLGIIDAKCRLHENVGSKTQDDNWQRRLEVLADLQKDCPETSIVHVGDRKRHIYGIFEWASQQASRPNLLIRALFHRGIQPQEGLLDQMGRLPIAGSQTISYAHQGNLPPSSIRLDLRFDTVTLQPPRNDREKSPIHVGAVYAVEAETRKKKEINRLSGSC